jgi:uncharacterized protein
MRCGRGGVAVVCAGIRDLRVGGFLDGGFGHAGRRARLRGAGAADDDNEQQRYGTDELHAGELTPRESSRDAAIYAGFEAMLAPKEEWREIRGFMTGPTTELFLALSEDELERLSDLLDTHAALDLEGVLGLLHAIAVAPGLMPPSSWLQTVLPREAAIDAEALNELLPLVMRQYNEVLRAMKKDVVIMPGPEDVDGCKAFAYGFTAGAERDPEWKGKPERWILATPFAYLAGRHDLLTPTMLEGFKIAENAEQKIRTGMGDYIWDAENAFVKIRSELAAAAAASANVRIGRNDPCPCGSGKKYKRCCLDKPSVAN